MAQPRGLPEDVSIEIQRESNNDGPDGHSHSHFILKELLEYDWDKSINLEHADGDTYRSAVGADYLEELCTELSQYGEPEEVRIVFWFDN